MMYYMGFDIGGTKCAVVLGDETGTVLDKRRFATAEKDGIPRAKRGRRGARERLPGVLGCAPVCRVIAVCRDVIAGARTTGGVGQGADLFFSGACQGVQLPKKGVGCDRHTDIPLCYFFTV